MSTTYPAAIDPPTTYQDLIDRPYAAHLNQAYERILKIQQVLGINPQAGYADVAARISALVAPPSPLSSFSQFEPINPIEDTITTVFTFSTP
jgi:hypothetical protein